MKSSNPALYRQLSEPLAGAEEANEAITAFFDDVYELRKKHHIRDVHIVVAGLMKTADGEDETEFGASAHLGNEIFAERMIAAALGEAAARRQEYHGALMKKAAITRQRDRL